MKPIYTIDEVIAQLGGVAAVAALTGRSKTNVCNWRAEGCFAARVFNVMRLALEQRGMYAPPELWRQVGSVPLDVEEAA